MSEALRETPGPSPESDHFEADVLRLADLVERVRSWWSGPRAPSYSWVLGRRTSFRPLPLPPAEDDAWWEALRIVAGAVALLEERAVWTSHDDRAARRYSRRKPKKRGCHAHHRRAVKWTAVGAVERAAEDPCGRAAQLVLEVCRRASGGKPLALVEEEGGWRAIMKLLRRVERWIGRVTESGGCERRRKKRRRRKARAPEATAVPTSCERSCACPETERSETRVSDPGGTRSAPAA